MDVFAGTLIHWPIFILDLKTTLIFLFLPHCEIRHIITLYHWTWRKSWVLFIYGLILVLHIWKPQNRVHRVKFGVPIFWIRLSRKSILPPANVSIYRFLEFSLFSFFIFWTCPAGCSAGLALAFFLTWVHLRASPRAPSPFLFLNWRGRVSWKGLFVVEMPRWCFLVGLTIVNVEFKRILLAFFKLR